MLNGNLANCLLRVLKDERVALRPIRILSLCAGIGGLDLGLRIVYGKRAVTVCYVERELHAAAVLAARMQDKSLCQAPIWSDIKTFDPGPWAGCVDVIVAGYPCQPFSVAGRRAGENDPRHLWPHIKKITEAIKPAVLFCENVPGHLTLGFDEVCQDLSGMGYRAEAGLFSALEVGAPQLRQRLFFLAYTDSVPVRQQQYGGGKKGRSQALQSSGHGKKEPVANANGDDGGEGRPKSALFFGGDGAAGGGGKMADPNGLRKLQRMRAVTAVGRRIEHGGRQTQRRAFEPRLGRIADGLSGRLDIDPRPWAGDWERDVARTTTERNERIDRLRALGNAVIPQVAAHAWRQLAHVLV